MYGETSGTLLPLRRVAFGRMTELGRMNHHHVYDDEVPDHGAKGHRMETVSWIEDFKPTADDLVNERCRFEVQQCKDSSRDYTQQGTPPHWTHRGMHSLAESKLPRGKEQSHCGTQLWHYVIAEAGVGTRWSSGRRRTGPASQR